MANKIKLAGTTSNDFQVGLTGTGNIAAGNIDLTANANVGGWLTVTNEVVAASAVLNQNANTIGAPGLRITGNYVSGGGSGQIQTLNYRGAQYSPTPLNDNDYTFQIQNLAYTGPTGVYEPVANYGFAGDFAFHKNDEIPTPTGFNYVGGFFQIVQFGNDGTNDNTYDYKIQNGTLTIGGFSPTDSFGPANTNFTVTVQDSTGATNSFSFLNNGNFSGANNVTANFFYGDGGHLSNLQVANVSGLGNIATINLDGSSSNVLYGDGTWAPAGGGSYGNSNVAGFLASFGSNTISTTGVITANGSGLSSLNGSNVTGQVPYAAVANSVAVANVGGIGNIATINLDGNSSNLLYGNGTFAPISITSVANANYANFAGQVVDATQSNITSLGTLTGLTVSGNGNVANLKLNQFQETVYSIGTTSGTITPDFNNGSIQSMTLNGNVTINSLGNAIAGRSMTLIINQDGTGNRTLTSSMLFAGNSKTLSTAASSKDLISVFYDGSSYWATLSKGYA